MKKRLGEAYRRRCGLMLATGFCPGGGGVLVTFDKELGGWGARCLVVK